MLAEVQIEKLYAENGAFNSFTAYVKDFSAQLNIAESTIWRKFKAGKFYTQYTTQLEVHGEEVIPAEKLDMSEENLVLVEKVGNGVMIEPRIYSVGYKQGIWVGRSYETLTA